jgi:DNA topoisomerase IB
MAEKAIDGMLAKNAADLAKEQEVSRRCFAFSARGVNHQVMRIMKAFKLK